MATLTSVKSGYWSDPTVWDLGVVPANGDSVTIASGHTVIFDVDQSSFTNGLAGLTINGTLKIPSQQEDSNMPNFVCLKVNANIAGTGSFLIGSPTYPIEYPQSVKVMVNGSITVATFNVYGEERLPNFDYLAQTSNAGTNTIVLQNGIPLRAGDLIAIGILGTPQSGEPWIYTVQSYDSSTKTVTLTQNLVTTRLGNEPYSCLVILLSRQVIISKYGAVSAAPIAGSGRYIQGVLFSAEPSSTIPKISTASSTTYRCCSNTIAPPYFSDSGSNITFINSTFYYLEGGMLLGIAGTVSITNSAFIRCYRPLNPGSISGNFSINNTHFQYLDFVLNITHPNGSATLSCNNVTIKQGSFLGSVGYSYRLSNISGNNITIVNGNFCESSQGGGIIGKLTNVRFYINDTNRTLINQNSALFIIEYLEVNNTSPIYNVTLVSGQFSHLILRNVTVNGRGFICSGASNVFVSNCSITQAQSPLGSALGRVVLSNISVNAYSRPTVLLTSPATIPFNSISIAKINDTNAIEKVFYHGYIKNRWDAQTPDYSTFDFYLTNLTYAAPLYLDYRVYGSSQISVSGIITQLGSGETVKVQIFSADKEPLFGDTPNFEQVYTSTGTINVSWTPPSAGEWVVRIQAEMNQTTNPVTIQNLQVGTEGGGGTTPTPVEPAFVFVG